MVSSENAQLLRRATPETVWGRKYVKKFLRAMSMGPDWRNPPVLLNRTLHLPGTAMSTEAKEGKSVRAKARFLTHLSRVAGRKEHPADSHRNQGRPYQVALPSACYPCPVVQRSRGAARRLLMASIISKTSRTRTIWLPTSPKQKRCGMGHSTNIRWSSVT